MDNQTELNKLRKKMIIIYMDEKLQKKIIFNLNFACKKCTIKIHEIQKRKLSSVEFLR